MRPAQSSRLLIGCVFRLMQGCEGGFGRRRAARLYVFWFELAQFAWDALRVSHVRKPEWPTTKNVSIAYLVPQETKRKNSTPSRKGEEKLSDRSDLVLVPQFENVPRDGA